MTQSLVTVVLFVALMLALPLLLRFLQRKRSMGLAGTAEMASKIVSAMAVGPQQRVITVEVGPEESRTWLVLGVTGQSITCLHTLPAGGARGSNGVGAAGMLRDA